MAYLVFRCSIHNSVTVPGRELALKNGMSRYIYTWDPLDAAALNMALAPSHILYFKSLEPEVSMAATLYRRTCGRL